MMVLLGYEKCKNFEALCNGMRKNVVAMAVTLTGEPYGRAGTKKGVIGTCAGSKKGYRLHRCGYEIPPLGRKQSTKPSRVTTIGSISAFPTL
jgi:hypothetical protein